MKNTLTIGCQDGDSGQDRIESHVDDTKLRCSEVMICPDFIGPPTRLTLISGTTRQKKARKDRKLDAFRAAKPV